MRRPISTLFAMVLVVGGIGCEQAKDSESAATDAGAAEEQDDDGGSTIDIDVTVENSNEILQLHIDDLNNLKTAAAELELAEIESNANILATTYAFTVKTKITEEKYREAQFEWDKAESTYEDLETSYNAAASAELSEAWQSYQNTRAVMIELKALWEQYRQ